MTRKQRERAQKISAAVGAVIGAIVFAPLTPLGLALGAKAGWAIYEDPKKQRAKRRR